MWNPQEQEEVYYLCPTEDTVKRGMIEYIVGGYYIIDDLAYDRTQPMCPVGFDGFKYGRGYYEPEP